MSKSNVFSVQPRKSTMIFIFLDFVSEVGSTKIFLHVVSFSISAEIYKPVKK